MGKIVLWIIAFEFTIQQMPLIQISKQKWILNKKKIEWTNDERNVKMNQREMEKKSRS